jgi:hypothetical protein
MDPVTLIVTALAAGATLRLGNGASTAGQDAYASLWARVRRRMSGRPDGAMLLARHAEAPLTWEGPLRAELVAAGAACDAELATAAAALLRLADENGYRAGKYIVSTLNAAGTHRPEL